VIFDNECREYRQGWNANNNGAHYLSNPYSCLAYDGELHRLWQKGYNDSQDAWDSPDEKIPESFPDDVVKASFSITDQPPAW
jgi:hypothetical protein